MSDQWVYADDLVDRHPWTEHLAWLLAHRRVGFVVYDDERDQPTAAEQHDARMHMRDMHHAGWRQLDTDEATVDRVAHAIHEVYCGCDGTLHSAASSPYPYMAQAAIHALLGGDQ